MERAESQMVAGPPQPPRLAEQNAQDQHDEEQGDEEQGDVDQD